MEPINVQKTYSGVRAGQKEMYSDFTLCESDRIIDRYDSGYCVTIPTRQPFSLIGSGQVLCYLHPETIDLDRPDPRFKKRSYQVYSYSLDLEWCSILTGCCFQTLPPEACGIQLELGGSAIATIPATQNFWFFKSPRTLLTQPIYYSKVHILLFCNKAIPPPLLKLQGLLYGVRLCADLPGMEDWSEEKERYTTNFVHKNGISDPGQICEGLIALATHKTDEPEIVYHSGTDTIPRDISLTIAKTDRDLTPKQLLAKYIQK